MVRNTIFALCIALPFVAQATSLKEYSLHQTLQQVAKTSSEGTPRKINDDLLDTGYTVEGNTLINHIEVSAKQAKEMREYPKAMHLQLGANVCRNKGFSKLMQEGAMLSYRFTEKGNNKLIAEELFVASDCGI